MILALYPSDAEFKSAHQWQQALHESEQKQIELEAAWQQADELLIQSTDQPYQTVWYV